MQWSNSDRETLTISATRPTLSQTKPKQGTPEQGKTGSTSAPRNWEQGTRVEETKTQRNPEANNFPASEHSQAAIPNPKSVFAAANGAAIAPSKATPQEQGAESPVEGGESQGFLPVLRNRNFLALWSGQVFSQLADKVYLVLMIALIDSQFQTGGQTISGWVSAIMMAFTIPAVLFGSLAGVFVDRWSKRTVLVSTNILRGLLVLGLPSLLWLSKGWAFLGGLPTGFYLMLLVTFLVSTLTQFFAPAEQAAIPMIVERRHLLSANSLYTTTMMVLVVIGFAVGEPLLALADTVWFKLGGESNIGKELLVGGSYAIAGLLLILLKTGEKVGLAEHESPHILADLRDGWRYLNDQRRVRSALVQLIVLFSVFAALSVLAVRLAELIPGLKPSQFGFLMSAGGVGIGIGSAILAHYGQRFSHAWLGLWGSVGVAASLIGLALLPHRLWLVLLLVMFVGVFGALVAVPMQTTIQKETPPEMHGKVFGLQNNAVNIAMSLPLALAGVAESLFGLEAVFLTLAAAALAGGVFTAISGKSESIDTSVEQ